MISSNKDTRTIEWAVNLFRPVLIDLNIPNLKDKNELCTSNYKLLCRYHMDRCDIIVKRFHFSNENYKGVFIWRYIAEIDTFVLYIIVNDNLFTRATSEERIYRKAITTHEFTHCIATILTSERLNDKTLIKRQSDKLKKRFHAIEQNDIKNLMTDVSISMTEPESARLLAFPDEHFRTGDEDFVPMYNDLYRNMLLSYSLFTEFFDNDKRKQFKAFYKKGDKLNASKIIASVLADISTKKCLDINFVLARFREEFVSKALKDLSK